MLVFEGVHSLATQEVRLGSVSLQTAFSNLETSGSAGAQTMHEGLHQSAGETQKARTCSTPFGCGMTGPGAKPTPRWPVTLTCMAMFQMESGGRDGEMADFAGVLHCLCIRVASGYIAISLSRFLRLECVGCRLFGMHFFFSTESFIFHSWG